MRVSYVYRIDRESLTLTNQLRWIQLVVWVPKICEIVCGLLLMHWLYERSANERKLQLRIDQSVGMGERIALNAGKQIQLRL